MKISVKSKKGFVAQKILQKDFLVD